jgi:hypothetical protein
MLYKRYGPKAPWEAQLFVYIHQARLTPKQQGILNEANEFFWNLGIECEVYQKPLRLQTSPLEHPFALCSPPDEDAGQGFAGIAPDDDIPFKRWMMECRIGFTSFRVDLQGLDGLGC